MIQKILTDLVWPFVVENRQVIIISILVFAKECLEFWLGRTKKVEAGSTLELFILFIKKIKNAFKS